MNILDRIPHIRDLGCDTVLFGPVFQSLSHGYDTSDYFKTDRAKGSIFK